MRGRSHPGVDHGGFGIEALGDVLGDEGPFVAHRFGPVASGAAVQTGVRQVVVLDHVLGMQARSLVQQGVFGQGQDVAVAAFVVDQQPERHVAQVVGRCGRRFEPRRVRHVRRAENHAIGGGDPAAGGQVAKGQE